jgi:hypothetical protein
MAVASCETAPSQPVLRTAPRPARLVPTAQDSVPPTAAQRGYLCYRGTLGERPVQLELNVMPTTSPHLNAVGSANVDGEFRYLDSGEVFGIPMQGFPASKPLEIEQDLHEALFCTDQPIGPLLTGTYRLQGQLVPFRVREDYSDCLRYEVLDETTGVAEPESTLVSRSYLHLLGADTLRPAHARLQCPTPARRRQARAMLAKRLDARQQRNQYLALSLNQAALFAYTLEERLEYTGSSRYETSTRQFLYDLRTGQQLTLFDQLRPGGQRRLRQLLTRQALADTVETRRRDYWRKKGGAMYFPAAGFAVTPEGLVAQYGLTEADIEPYFYSQILTWESLRPLLRPTSPLHRLLKASTPMPSAQ